MTLLQPSDPRWQGPQRWYLIIDLVKNVVLLAFSILIIVETSLYRYWYNAYHRNNDYVLSDTAIDFFFRIGMAFIPDIISVILTHALLFKGHFHPVYALVQSLIVFCLYPICFAFNLIIVYSNESWMDRVDAWQRMCYGEIGLQGVLLLCWVAMVVYACIAVDKWRGKKAGDRMRVVAREELELKNVDDGRKDSANVDAERDALVDGSVKSSRAFV